VHRESRQLLGVHILGTAAALDAFDKLRANATG